MQFLRHPATLGAAFLLTTTAPVANSLWPRPEVPTQTAPPTGQTQAPSEKAQAMATGASPAFLVATIKPTDPNTTRQGWSFESEGRRITCFNATLRDIVRLAYGVHVKQIVDEPEWFSKDRFDVNGVPDQPGVPSIKQIQHMYQELLADRFHLVFHRDTREMPIYALTVARGGPILTPAGPEQARSNAGNSGGIGFRVIKATNLSLSDLALNLNSYEDWPVIDQTSLPGRYNFTLKWSYDVSSENEPNAPPSLVTALKEQLGLRLDAVKGPAPVLVIDHVEHPTQN